MKKYEWEQVKKATDSVYRKHSHRDSWGVRVVYRNTFIKALKEELCGKTPFKQK